MKTQRIYLCIDKGMIWEAYSDKPIYLIIRNIDKEWIRKLDTVIAPEKIDEQEELLTLIKDEQYEFPGLPEETAKHTKIIRPLSRKK